MSVYARVQQYSEIGNTKKIIQKHIDEINHLADDYSSTNVYKFEALTQCKDCKFKRYTAKPGYLGCDRHGYSFGLHPVDWFCGDGTPAEEE